MKEPAKTEAYKSPPRKLVKFFEKSRDQWKYKYRETKKIIKQLKNRIRFLEVSKEHWKNRVKELESELTQLRTEKQLSEDEIKTLEKKTVENPKEFIEPFGIIPFHHKYSIAHIELFLTFVLSAAASLRCAGRMLEVVLSFFKLPFPSPSWSSGRLWLLRLGYYKLMRPKEPGDDWVWIVDHTVQAGEDKCLVILGFRLPSLPPVGTCLHHEDTEPIELLPVKKSNGEIVYQQLESAARKTGIPREIIADKGTDLSSGIEKFCRSHPETVYIYDIKHKTAAILKRELANDEIWQKFTQLAAKTKHRVHQTSLASLAPPAQKTKARYMNLDSLIQWGKNLLSFLDDPDLEKNTDYDPKMLQSKLGWITEFREELNEWEKLLEIAITTESFVRHQGLYPKASIILEKKLTCPTYTDRIKRVKEELIEFVKKESFKATPNERLLGSSEVIESVFGKLKRLEKDQAKNGFTAMLLSIAAMVSSTTKEVIQKAMESIPAEKVPEWCDENIGQTLQSKRKKVFQIGKNKEQKWDQLQLAG